MSRPAEKAEIRADAGIVDKSGVLERLASGDSAWAIELGCGGKKKNSHAIGIDALDYPAVDIVGDVFSVLARFPDGIVGECYSYHFFEHVPDLPRLMGELGRVMRPGGLLKIVVPHFSNPYFYSDYTHERFFGLYSFSYFCLDRKLKRRVPLYQHEPLFELVDARLGFRASRPSPVLRAVKRLTAKLFNASWPMRELYEEQFCWWFPCYELTFSMTRIEAARPVQ